MRRLPELRATAPTRPRKFNNALFLTEDLTCGSHPPPVAVCDDQALSFHAAGDRLGRSRPDRAFQCLLEQGPLWHYRRPFETMADSKLHGLAGDTVIFAD